MQKDREFSQQQQLALRMAFLGKATLIKKNMAVHNLSNQNRLKLLILRAYIIYKRRHHIEHHRLIKYKLDFQSRFKKYLKLNPNNYKFVPSYLFIFLEDIEKWVTPQNNITPVNQNQINTFTNNSNNFDNLTVEFNKIHVKSTPQVNYKRRFKFNYHLTWAKLCLAICTNHPIIVALKKHFGCISLIPITIKREHIRIKNVCIHYHDLCHLEVARLDRIQMGKHMVSGIHGLAAGVFHEVPVEREYDGFLDEARIAIHEWLTRTTIFSSIKLICWLILLILYGINPIAVVIRHIRSLNKKQHELKMYLS